MYQRKQGDLTPLWSIIIWEDPEETDRLATLPFKGDFNEVEVEANKLLDFYKEQEIFEVSHFTIE